jgi:hypothetical protein
VAALDFQRAYQTSIGNTRLLHTISQQLGVPPTEALSTAESLLGVQLICALGGQYQWTTDAALPFWASTHWPELRQGDSEKGLFASPSMAWFRGLDLQVTMLEDRVTGHATLEIQQPVNDKPTLPFFDFLRR